MTEEQQKNLREDYDNMDVITLNRKVREAMLVIINAPEKSKEEGYPLYEHITLNFNQRELVHIACIYIAKELATRLKEDPKFLETVRMIRMLTKMQQKE